MRTHRILLSLVMLVSLLFAVSQVGAQPTEPYPIGEVTLEAKQIAAGVGFSWGDGTLKFKEKTYPFKLKGLNVAAVGISAASAKGDVYNLVNAADFAGTYVAIEAGASVIKGPAGLLMRNAKGVVINLRSVQTGVQLSLGLDGFTISMK
ncbi:MAG: hypothetical protein Q8M54_04835 [Desulfobaccales bacterium]|nr:hypothetical protein [Desulfobaccales bacterium]